MQTSNISIPKNNRNFTPSQAKFNKNSVRNNKNNKDNIISINAYRKQSIVKPYIKTYKEWFNIPRADDPSKKLSHKSVDLASDIIYQLDKSTSRVAFLGNHWFKNITHTERKQAGRLRAQLSDIFNFTFHHSITVNNVPLFNVYEISYTENATDILNCTEEKIALNPIENMAQGVVKNVPRLGQKCPTPTYIDNSSLDLKNDGLQPSSFFRSSKDDNCKEAEKNNFSLHCAAGLLELPAQWNRIEEGHVVTTLHNQQKPHPDQPSTIMSDSKPQQEKTRYPLPDTLKRLIPDQRGEQVASSLTLYFRGDDNYLLEISQEIDLTEDEKDSIRTSIRAQYGERIKLSTKRSDKFRSPIETFAQELRIKCTDSRVTPTISMKEMQYDRASNSLEWNFLRVFVEWGNLIPNIEDFVQQTGITVKMMHPRGEECWQVFTKEGVDKDRAKQYAFMKKFLAGKYDESPLSST